ncbi:MULTISPECIES: helix-turn-helix transcriptional regulator [Myxococcaceae]|jgi:transcriptional regulator with XRE-family HTH domain|uniref:Helix-turn-helix domain-containing protein n=1 Tax=Pyxidicoccus fallax TaxID=394095 RepID=A0A848LH33_9BACT|nr:MULTISPECIES: helix-turn-helix domain-containing protein [Myxococcaceae]MBZ4418352.1 helix-turn-helix domain-containing protein [Myxococcus sp. RHSTA-1-4]NMO17193.1 helix-turn-helix domain-containing protein [Pyxidicoccus fallax]NPC80477.1 helix-turn-helix domain-containing protein [Pyxidicoccus fallax]
MEKTLASRLGGAARLARTRLNLTQADVAERIGIASEVYGRLERGHMLPSIQTFRRLCVVLSISADEALGLKPSQEVKWAAEPPSDYGESAELRRLMRRARQLDRSSIRILSVLAAQFKPKGS